MKFLKVAKQEGRYYIIVDKMPLLRYEHIGNDYVGKNYDDNHNLLCTHKYGYSKAVFGMKAYGGSKIAIPLVDGTVVVLQDDYWDSGADSSVGESIHVALMSEEDYKKHRHFRNAKGFYFIKAQFKALLDEYLLRNRLYSFWELENIKMSADVTTTFA